MQKILLTLLTALFLQAGEIRVAVAANVSYAVPELKKAFLERFPDTKVEIILGSSGKLTAQIRNGAPYDLFLSANMIYPEALFADGSAITKPIVYARGALAILSPKPRNFSKGIKSVTDPAIGRIAVANTKTAPYGKAAVEAMAHAGILESLKSKFIHGESISQTLTYTLKAADIGFVAKSALFSPKLSHFKEGENWIEVDPNLYTPIDQGIVLLKRAQKSREASAFFTFMLTKKARKILRDFGYTTP
jgi:molybdate transport system substrate-binding protein